MQDQVYAEVAKPLVRAIIDGKNAAVIAYGQTGSGKTHTMLGPSQGMLPPTQGMHPLSGITPRLLHDIFDHVEKLKAESFSQVSVSASYIEIYQEHVLDLLCPIRQQNLGKSLDAYMKEFGGALNMMQDSWGIRVVGACQEPVLDIGDVMSILQRGGAVRATAETSCNAYSSRSHAIMIVTILHSNSLTGRDTCSQVYLCDLAGSERLIKSNAKGSQLREAQSINRGLLALTNVINALTQQRIRASSSSRAPFVPYRDSKLTRVLQNAFGGNGKTALICNISPSALSYHETISTLRFGARCQLVQNVVRANLKLGSRAELDKLLSAAESIIFLQKAQIKQSRLKQLRCICNSDRLLIETTPTRIAIAEHHCEAVLGISLTELMCPLTKAPIYDPVWSCK